MSMDYPYYNEAGEPLMDGAAMRLEMDIDSDPMTYYCNECGLCHTGDCRDYDDYDEPEDDDE